MKTQISGRSNRCFPLLTSPLRLLGFVVMGAMACTGTTAPAHGLSLTHGWNNNGLQQFYPLGGSAWIFSPDSPTYTEWYAVRGGFNAKTGDNYPMSFKGPAGCWVRADLRVPNTNGTVGPNLSRIRLAFTETAKSFRVQVCNDDNPDTGVWSTVVADTNTAGASAFQEFNFTATPCKFVRIVNISGGYLYIDEVDFFGTVTNGGTAATFNSPGTILTKSRLDQVKTWINTNTHPARVDWAFMSARPYAVANYQPRPVGTIIMGPGGNREQLDYDSEAAYMNALMWYIRQGQADANTYAENAKRILNAWSATNTGVQADGYEQGRQIPEATAGLIYAADILRGGAYTKYSGWDSTTENNFRTWYGRLATTAAETELSIDNNHGNWSTVCRGTMLAWAAYTRDRYNFNRLVELHKRQLSDSTEASPWGEVRETTRVYSGGVKDTAHMQMFLSGAVRTAEMAWNQGVDLYSWGTADDSRQTITYTSAAGTQVTLTNCPGLGSRIANMMDYHAEILEVGNNVSPAPQNLKSDSGWPGFFKNENGSTWYGDGVGGVNGWGWEYSYFHYKNRMSPAKELPYVRKKIQYMRDNNIKDGWIHSAGWGTITHPGNPSPISSAIRVEAYDPPAQKFSTNGTADTHRVFSDPSTFASASNCAILEANATGDWVAYDVTGVQARSYDVYVQFKKGSDRGKCQVAIAGVTGGTPGTFDNHGSEQDLYNTNLSFNRVSIARVTFGSSGTKRFKFTSTGQNGSATVGKYYISVDYIELVPVG